MLEIPAPHVHAATTSARSPCTLQLATVSASCTSATSCVAASNQLISGTAWCGSAQRSGLYSHKLLPTWVAMYRRLPGTMHIRNLSSPITDAWQ